jgi:hypothetical protein
MLDDRLARAAEKGDTVSVVDLIEECRSYAPEAVDDDLQLALLWASIGGQVETITAVVACGANVAKPEASRGSWPLIEAARNGHREAVELLVNLGAPIDVKDHYGWTAADRARMNGHGQLSRWLEEAQQLRMKPLDRDDRATPNTRHSMTLFILEDNLERQAAFRQVCRELDLEVEIWNSAPRMIAALSMRPREACIFSLDHDLYDPKEELGDGMMLVDFLLQQAPFAPVLIHSSNSERSGLMRDRLLEAGWEVKRVPPLSMGETWIFTSWADKLRSLIL